MVWSGLMGYLLLSLTFVQRLARRPTLRCRRGLSTMATYVAPTLEPGASNQVIVLSGATSVGKSAVSRKLCRTLGNCEIVVADSVQVYKYVDIGSNKPSVEEMRETPHHLVSVFDPHETFSVGDFVREAAPVIYDILNRGKTPIVVGGSTMWIEWLVQGVPDAPRTNASISKMAQEFLKEAKESGDWDAAMLVMQRFDAVRASKLSKNDWYRANRYLEVALALQQDLQEGKESVVSVAEVSSSTSSSSSSAAAAATTPLVAGTRTPMLPGLDVRCFFVSEDRELLYRKIDKRCEEMIKGGLLQEVTSLLLEEKITPSSICSKAIGYRQTIEYLCDPHFRALDVAAFDNYVKDFATATRNYAKRQLGWYRKDNSFLWLQITRPDPRNRSSDEAPYQRVAEEVLYWCSLPRSNYGQMIKHQIRRGVSVSTLRIQKNLGQKLVVKGEQDWLAVAAMVASGELRVPQVGEELLPDFLLTHAKSSSESGGGGSDGGDGGDGGEEGKAPFEARANFIGSGGSARFSIDPEAIPLFPNPPLPPPTWSAEDILIRSALGKGPAKLKTYENRYKSAVSGFDSLVLSLSADADALQEEQQMQEVQRSKGDFDEEIRTAAQFAELLRERHPLLVEEFGQMIAEDRTVKKSGRGGGKGGESEGED